MPQTEILAEVSDEQVYSGYDSMALIQFCTPGFFGCKVCISANTVGNYVVLELRASTPFGSYAKSFKITKNVCFTWKPLGLFKVEICVKNFAKVGRSFRFTASVKGCLNVPIFGWKCASYSYNFNIPTPFSESHAGLMDTNEEIDEKDYSTYLALYALATQEQGAGECDCH